MQHFREYISYQWASQLQKESPTALFPGREHRAGIYEPWGAFSPDNLNFASLVSRTARNNILLFNVFSLWHFAVAALADWDKSGGLSEDFVGKCDDGSALSERSRESDSVLPSDALSRHHGIRLSAMLHKQSAKCWASRPVLGKSWLRVTFQGLQSVLQHILLSCHIKDHGKLSFTSYLSPFIFSLF